MSLYAVTREAGPNWIDGSGAFHQPAANEHAAFMNGLADEGLVLFAGPLAGTEAGRIRVLLIVDVADAAEVYDRLADDPWARAELLRIVSVEPWMLLIGAERLAGPTQPGR